MGLYWTGNGSDKLIGFASRTLIDTEVFPSGKGGSGMRIWSNSRFHAYLFTLITDNKVIMSLFNSNKPISPQASGRIQRWALKLATYKYTLRFQPTNQHSNADALSRLLFVEKPKHVPVPAEQVLLIEHLSETPLRICSTVKTLDGQRPPSYSGPPVHQRGLARAD